MSEELEKEQEEQPKQEEHRDELAEVKEALNRVLNELDAVRKDVAEMKAREDEEDDEVEYEGTQF